MKLSVVITTYNNSQYIEGLLESIIEGNPLEGKYEIILIDDCSKDNTLEVASNFLKKKNVSSKLMKNEINSGYPGKGLNRGVAEATGEYIHFVDGDDVVLSKNYSVLNEIDEDILVYEHFSFDHSLNSIARKGLDKAKIVHDENKFYNRLQVTYWDCLIKRSFILESGVKFIEDGLVQDSIFMHKLAHHFPRYASVDKPIYIYRTGHDSVSKKIGIHVLRNLIKSFKISYDLSPERANERINYIFLRASVVRVESKKEFDVLMRELDYLMESFEEFKPKSKLPNAFRMIFYAYKTKDYNLWKRITGEYLEIAREFELGDIKFFRRSEIIMKCFKVPTRLFNLRSFICFKEYLQNNNDTNGVVISIVLEMQKELSALKRIPLKKAYKALKSRGKCHLLKEYCKMFNEVIGFKYDLSVIESENHNEINFEGKYPLSDYVSLSGEHNIKLNKFFLEEQKLHTQVVVLNNKKPALLNLNIVDMEALNSNEILIHKSLWNKDLTKLSNLKSYVKKNKIQFSYVPLDYEIEKTVAFKSVEKGNYLYLEKHRVLNKIKKNKRVQMLKKSSFYKNKVVKSLVAKGLK